MTKTLAKVGPADHGKRMSLEDFDKAEAQEGHLYELSRGVITVSGVPKGRHLAQIKVLRLQLFSYDVAHPGIIDTVAGGSECKILLAELESERHPDLAVYKSSSEGLEEDSLWMTWVPDLVIEVVSSGSEERDYGENREEYLRFGVREYWIVDASRDCITVLKRWGGRWREQIVKSQEKYNTPLLPGFTLDLAAVFEAASQYPE